jgi:hypothetical protein
VVVEVGSPNLEDLVGLRDKVKVELISNLQRLCGKLRGRQHFTDGGLGFWPSVVPAKRSQNRGGKKPGSI